MKKIIHKAQGTGHKARILVTNDDGINAPGLKVLERIARVLSDDVWVVAPEMEQSGAAHSLTLLTPVRVRNISPRRYAVSGTPTDCVLLGLTEIIPSAGKKAHVKSRKDVKIGVPSDHHVSLVLSGVNGGSNVGDDVTYSGTVAAAMEGTILDVPSIAFSQLGEFDRMHWKTAEHFAPKLIPRLIKAGWPKGTLLNVNFPDCTPDNVKGVRVCAQGKRLVSIALSERLDPKMRPYFWIGGEREDKSETPGSDIDLLQKGYITVTPLCMNLTDHATMRQLEAGLKQD